GTHSLTAEYSGDETYATGSGSATLVITKGMPTITLTSSQNPSAVGTNVTFTAATAPGATGSIEFLDGTTPSGTGAIANGQATFTTSTLTQGTHVLKATYVGDTNYAAAASETLNQVVDAAVNGADAGTGGGGGPGIDGGLPGLGVTPLTDEDCSCRV